MRRGVVCWALLLGFSALPYGAVNRYASTEPCAMSSIHPMHARHLANVWRVHPKVMSGGQPDGEAAFRELKALGVKTIVSVDGAKPDAALARQHGMRYIHLPHGYDGIPEARVLEIACALRDAGGPVYVHCHHGKHRGPAAAAAACVTLGWLKADGALDVLKLAGTSKRYRGLYDTVITARPVEAKRLDKLQVDFREAAPIPPTAEAMVAIERLHDRLTSLAQRAWKPAADDPDLNAAHEALLLKEQFVELQRTDETRRRPVAFQQLLRESVHATAELEAALRDTSNDQTPRATDALRQLDRSCTHCHHSFRDTAD